jgi:sialate O-acetylesterase
MHLLRTLLAAGLLLLAWTTSLAQLRLPQLFQDGMVLQRQAPIQLWGWAGSGERIRVEWDGKRYQTQASAEGKWALQLPAMPAGGPYVLTIRGKQQTLELTDLLIGDVWLCAGQSNMVHQLDIHDVTYAEDIAQANFPQIRHFKIPTQTELQGSASDFEGGTWEQAVGEAVRPFSAVAYFFARDLYQDYQVPIGLINASVGGTPIEAWISEEGFEGFADELATIARNRDTAYVNGLERARAQHQAEAGEAKEVSDQGLTGPKPWYAVDFVPQGWRRINIPGYWEDQGVKDLNGVVWYRREITLPASMAGQPARLFMGRIIDADEIYLNGQLIGQKTYQYPQRRYPIPAGLLQAGKNVMTIRVTNYGGKGGFVPDKPYYLFAGEDTVDLKGYWQYKVGEVFRPRPADDFPRGLNRQNQPTALYNAMVAPYRHIALKGVLWYQGESNTGRPQAYAELLPALIRDWRRQFDAPDLPFIYAQLPNFLPVSYLPEESQWAELREAQRQALSVPHTAMTVNIDLGEWNDIHPDNKKDVGERMALAARKLAYGEELVHSGPLYESHRRVGDTLVVSFSQVGSGLVSNDGEPLGEFALAGADGEFYWAEANIKGDEVWVWSEKVPDPRFLRYAWADNPGNPNLYNREGLPASPFRVD